MTVIVDLHNSNIIHFLGSLVRPKVVKSVHFCPTTGSFTTREYRDIASNTGLPTGSVYPTRVIPSPLFWWFSVLLTDEGVFLMKCSAAG